METKKEIRSQLLKIRESMPQDDWAQKSEIIQQKVINSDAFREEFDIYCYMDFRNEVSTKKILENAWLLGKTVYLPRVFGNQMEFHEVTSLKELEIGSFGVLEPKESAPVADGDYGLVIVPGVAFDKEGNRIGFGKGYYDKYLNAHKNLISMAIAFDCQILEKIPHDPDDHSLNYVVSESMTIENQEEK